MAGFNLSQSTQQRQEMLLQPKMLQAIAVLQLPSLDLEGFLRSRAEENEALCLEDSPRPFEPEGRRGTAEDSGRHDAWLNSQEAAEGGLCEQVEEQLSLLDVSENLLAWAHVVATSLDENGYLSASDEALLGFGEEQGLPADYGALGEAIAIVQRLEPRGIGGRDAVEALLLQLDPAEEDYELLCRLLEEFLVEIAKNKLPAVARGLGVELEHLTHLLDRLRELTLRPAAELVSKTAPPIRPDVIVESRENGTFTVRVDGSGFPAVSIDPGVRAMAKDREQAPEVRAYLRDRLERARWIVDALEQRQRTLQRITTLLFEHQRAFLQGGLARLVPLTMNHMADELGLHVSTVSRAVAGKYAETPHGTLPLRRFFQSSAGGQETAARENVREEVRKVIEAEDPAHPLSDDEVAARLKSCGLELARRTVAKYRKELDIPSSYRRRRY